MRRRFGFAVVVLLVFYFLSPVGFAQTEKQGLALLHEGGEIKSKARSKEDLDRALNKFEQALSIFEKIGSEMGKGTALLMAGDVHFASRRPEKAFECYEKSVTIVAKTGDSVLEKAVLKAAAKAYHMSDNFQKSLEYHQKLLTVCRKAGDTKQEGFTLNDMGVNLLKLSRYGEAIKHCEDASVIFKRLGNLKDEGTALSNMATAYGYLGQYQKALEYHRKTLAIDQKVGNVSGQMIALSNMGMVHNYLGQYDEALKQFEKSVEHVRKVGDVKTEAGILINLGATYSFLGQYRKALEHHEKSLSICRKEGALDMEGTNLNNMGDLYCSLEQYGKALECFQQAMKIRIRVGDKAGAATTLGNFAKIDAAMGQYQLALDFSEKALKAFSEIGDVKNQAVCLGRIADLYRVWGRYHKAMECYETSLAMARKIGDANGEAEGLARIGSLHAAMGQYGNALNLHGKSLDIFKRIGNVRGQGDAMLDIGEVYVQLGRPTEALKRFENALEIYSKIGLSTYRPKDRIANVYLDTNQTEKAEALVTPTGNLVTFARLRLVKKDYEGAKAYYEEILKAAQEGRNSTHFFVAHTGLGRVYEERGDNESAASHFRRALEISEEMRAGLSAAQRELFFQVRIGHSFLRKTPYEGLARVLCKMNRFQEALKESEYTKARMFAETISQSAEGVTFGIPPDVIRRDSELNDQLAALVDSLQKAYDKKNKEAIASLEPQVKQAREALAEHTEKVRNHYPLFVVSKYPQPMGLSSASLKRDEWVLSYDVTGQGVLIYLTRGKELVKGLFKPILREDVDGLVRKFRAPLEVVPGKDNIADKLNSFDFAAGKKLSDILVADILSELPRGAPVIVVPDDSLGVLPFEMLVLNSGGEIKTAGKIPCTSGAEFFGDRNPISYCQSITALTLARTAGKRKKSSDRLLIMADPVFDMKEARVQDSKAQTVKLAGAEAKLYQGLMVAMEEGKLGNVSFKRLSLTGTLAEGLNRTYEANTDTYTGLAATKKDFLEKIAPNLDRYDKIVFATHGYFGSDLPGIKEPVLVLSLVPPGTDGYLRMSEVMGLKLSADAVALTACQTGLGRHISGEGTMGMGRAFQYAGARSVLMSLWSVAELTSVKLVESFFKHVKEGKSKLEALRLARTEIRQTGYDHPFFWAAFILVGEPD